MDHLAPVDNIKNRENLKTCYSTKRPTRRRLYCTIFFLAKHKSLLSESRVNSPNLACFCLYVRYTHFNRFSAIYLRNSVSDCRYLLWWEIIELHFFIKKFARIFFIFLFWLLIITFFDNFYYNNFLQVATNRRSSLEIDKKMES